MIYTTGYRGEGIRSDCFISLEITGSGGLSVDLNSKVKALYGESIIDLCQSMLKYFGIRHARLFLEDSGALPFTIAARIEAAIKMSISTDLEYLLPPTTKGSNYTERDQERLTRLYLPGNNPKLMINAGIYGSNGIILDLEDSVAPDRKNEARLLVRNALRAIDFYGAERMVRINQLPYGLDDLAFCVPHQVNLILIPKCENSDQVVKVDEKISELLGNKNSTIHLLPIIESAAGLMNAFAIARASENVVALAIGLEDYTADIGVQRTAEGKESLFARSTIVNAAVAAGIPPLDSVFSDIGNMEALASAADESKSLGFTGMGCIHPRQVSVIRERFMPTPQEIERSKKIVLAFDKAAHEGSGVVALDSKMIDMPVVKRSLKVIEKAVNAGLLSENWREGYE
jgi:citrate lyase subunit beta/citryl-CoA lyase